MTLVFLRLNIRQFAGSKIEMKNFTNPGLDLIGLWGTRPRKMELALEEKFYLDFHWVTRPWRRTLTSGSDVKYVFPRCLSTQGFFFPYHSGHQLRRRHQCHSRHDRSQQQRTRHPRPGHSCTHPPQSPPGWPDRNNRRIRLKHSEVDSLFQVTVTELLLEFVARLACWTVLTWRRENNQKRNKS